MRDLSTDLSDDDSDPSRVHGSDSALHPGLSRFPKANLSMNGSLPRKRRRGSVQLESLESRTLLSVLLNSKPTVEVQIDRPRVRPFHGRGVSIIQPTEITVTGTAQPPAPNFNVQVEVFALDADGQVLNGGAPLAVATPNFLGLYRATFQLPSTIRKDMNTIVVRQQATGTITGTQTIDPTTLRNLSGTLSVDGTTISDLEAALSLNPGTLSNLQADLTVNGWLAILGGTVGLEPFIGLATNPDLTGSISGGTANESARDGTLANGTATIAPTGGTFAQVGQANIDATTGTLRLDINEFAVSDPVSIFIHQSRNQATPLRTNAPTGPAHQFHARSARSHRVDPIQKERRVRVTAPPQTTAPVMSNRLDIRSRFRSPSPVV